MFLLENPIKPYAWGSTTALAALQGREATGAPEAELWVGAHPASPSTIHETGASLAAHIAQHPESTLGAASLKHFGPTLPFLLKVLAAAHPLSLQAHPSRAQAMSGFARENSLGVPLSASTRNYKDENHKPELICALTPFHALCGFRKVDASLALFRGLGVSVPLLESRGLRAFFEQLFSGSADVKALVAQVAERCTTHPAAGFEAECRWGARLAAQYPGDAGLLGALVLNLVTLAPGEALYLPAGNLHAYLEGVGVELMASSDNVLRGGLTPKHVDAAELLAVLDFHDGPVPVLTPRGAPEAAYETPAPDFHLSRIDASTPVTLRRRGPEVVLVTQGQVSVSTPVQTLVLEQGTSAFIGADEGAVRVSGEGTAYRATVGQLA
ncbi:MAG: mannose-6-phosphate isomerase, class I [Archangium sp.]|nr:mannose-6-phosphate isomerase, class I [Archangium sp.]